MSIEKSGPQGYEYQYLGTVYTALGLIADDCELIELRSEGDEEDFAITVTKKGEQLKIKGQSKNVSGNIHALQLTEWLCHFESGSSEKFLAKTLDELADSIVLFITSGRAQISLDKLVEDPGVYSRKAIPLNTALKDEFLKNLYVVHTTSASQLEKERNENCVKFSKAISKSGRLKALMNKVFIWEKLSYDKISSACHSLLLSHFSIPLSQTKRLVDDLLALVRVSRNKSIDIAQDFLKTLERVRIKEPVDLKYYLDRENDPGFLQMLKHENVLLLKGNSMCGKSKTSSRLAFALVKKGFNHLATDDIRIAKEFLLQGKSEDKICELDDPFGHVYDDDTYYRYKQLLDLIGRLQPGSKLIVTCNNEVYKQVETYKSIGQWHDLTLKDSAFAIVLWKDLCARKNIPGDIEAKLVKYIQGLSETDMIQPGQIDHLAFEADKLAHASFAMIKKIASVDSPKILAVIKNEMPFALKVFQILGMVSSIIVPVDTISLQYIFRNPEQFPGFLEEDESGSIEISIGGDENEITYPEYGVLPGLSTEVNSALDFLERRGFIISENDSYRFKHHVYLNASHVLDEKLGKHEFKDLIKKVKACLGVLNPGNSLLAAKSLARLYISFPQPDRQSDIIALSQVAMASIHPSVSEAAYSFLSSIFEKLPQHMAKFMENFLLNLQSTEGIFWQNGVPFYSTSPTGWLTYMYDRMLMSDAAFKTAMNVFLRSESDYVAEQAWKIAYHIRTESQRDPLPVPKKALEKLLLSNEGFTRGVAAFHLMNSFPIPPEEEMDLIFSDENAEVVFQAIKGCFRGWPRYDETARKLVLKKINALINRKDVVIRMIHFMTEFGAGHSHHAFRWESGLIREEDIPLMWAFWADLFPLFVEQMPGHLYFNTGRFMLTVQESEDIISDEKKLEVALAFFKWFEMQPMALKDSQLFDVTDYYFRIQQRPLNPEVILQMVRNNNFEFAAHNLRYILKHWDRLFEVEQQSVIECIEKGMGEDMIAMALTMKQLPMPVSMAITGSDNFFSAPAKSYEVMSDSLFRKCLTAAFGHPYHQYSPDTAKVYWADQLKPFFVDYQWPETKWAFSSMLRDMFSSDESRPSLWEEEEKLFTSGDFLKSQELTDFLLLFLLERLMGNVQEKEEEEWTQLYNIMPDAGKERIVQLFSDNLELISYGYNTKVIYSILRLHGGSEKLKAIDFSVMGIIRPFLRNPPAPISPELAQELLDNITKILAKYHLRLLQTEDYLKKWIQNAGLQNNAHLNFQAMRRRIVDAASEQSAIIEEILNKDLKEFKTFASETKELENELSEEDEKSEPLWDV